MNKLLFIIGIENYLRTRLVSQSLPLGPTSIPNTIRLVQPAFRFPPLHSVCRCDPLVPMTVMVPDGPPSELQIKLKPALKAVVICQACAFLGSSTFCGRGSRHWGIFGFPDLLKA